MPPELWIGPSLDGRFNYREPTQIGRIKKLGIQKPWAPARSYGLVARLNADGEAVESLHSRVDGRIHGVTGLCVGRAGASLAASKGRNCLVELPLARRRTGISAMTRKANRRRCFSIVKGSKVYGGLHAIEGVDFDLRAGEIHALLGENGAGKSTLCKAIAGAITLTSGDYLIKGRRSNSASPEEALRRRRRHGLSGIEPRSRR